MTDMSEFEDDVARESQVFGSHDEIAETLNAYMGVAQQFGKSVLDAMVRHINRAVPLLAEVELRKPTNQEQWEAFIEDFFGTPEAEARSVDAMAEGIKEAQDWLRVWMDEHGIKVLSMWLPTLDGRGFRLWTFGNMRHVREEIPGIVGVPIRMASTMKVDPPQDSPEAPPEPGDGLRGYL